MFEVGIGFNIYNRGLICHTLDTVKYVQLHVLIHIRHVYLHSKNIDSVLYR